MNLKICTRTPSNPPSQIPGYTLGVIVLVDVFTFVLLLAVRYKDGDLQPTRVISKLNVSCI